MKLIRGLYNLRDHQRASAVTIGNFDGVHLGHQHLITTVCQQAADSGLRATVLSFEPLPVEYFVAESPPRLTSIREKISALKTHSLHQLLLLRFNQALADTRADEFIKQVLIDGLDTKYLLIGDDFQFGKDREGNFATLKAASEKYGFELHQAQTLEKAGARISSTRIRKELASGNITSAAELLGRDYALEGRVEYGAQLGRTLGFPTANIGLKNHNPPLRGVFAVAVNVKGDNAAATNAIANIGVKPTVHGVRLSLEVYLLDFSSDLYGKRLRITFLHKLRDEKKFAGLDELKTAIATDEQNARQWFAQNGL